MEGNRDSGSDARKGIELMENLFSLAGRNAFITGGTSGIGRAVAETLLAHGARVVAADITDGTKIAEDLGAGYVHVDVSDEESVAAALAAAVVVATVIEVTLSLDHRAIVGSLAQRFMAKIRENLEEPVKALL